jgi:hypothetical protein
MTDKEEAQRLNDLIKFKSKLIMIKTLSPGLIFFLNYLALKHHFKKTPN